MKNWSSELDTSVAKPETINRYFGKGCACGEGYRRARYSCDCLDSPGLRERGWTPFLSASRAPRPWRVPTCVPGSSAGRGRYGCSRAGRRGAEVANLLHLAQGGASSAPAGTAASASSRGRGRRVAEALTVKEAEARGKYCAVSSVNRSRSAAPRFCRPAALCSRCDSAESRHCGLAAAGSGGSAGRPPGSEKHRHKAVGERVIARRLRKSGVPGRDEGQIGAPSAPPPSSSS